MSRRLIFKSTRGLFYVVLCFLLLFSSSVTSLAKPVLEELMLPLTEDVSPPRVSEASEIEAVDSPLVGLIGDPCFYTSIGAAVVAADPGDTIYIPVGIYNERIGEIGKDLTLTASSPDCATEIDPADYTVEIDASLEPTESWGGIINVGNASTVTLKNLYLHDGSAFNGGLIYVTTSSKVVLDDTHLGYGTATLFGGGVYSYGSVDLINGSSMFSNQVTGSGVGGAVALASVGELNLYDDSQIGYCNNSFWKNISVTDGGGVYNNGGTINLYDNSSICTNNAVIQGGGVYATGAAVVNLYDNAVIGGSTVDSGNTAVDGAGVYLTGTAAMNVFDQGSIEYNSATDDGGGVAVQGNAVLTLDGPEVSVSNNTAVTSGGGIYVGDVTPGNNPGAVIQNGAGILSNTANYGGGAIFDSNSSITLDYARVFTNTADVSGGGLYLINSAILNIANSEIRGNQALIAHGGGISADFGVGGSPMVIIRDSVFEGNSAQNDGGGIHSSGAAINIQDTTDTTAFIDNSTVLGSGGAIYHTGSSTLEMYATGETYRIQIDSNISGDDGGGIYSDDGTLDFQGNIHITNNEAANSGGGIYIKGGGDHRIRDWNNNRPWISGNITNGGAGGGIALDSVDETVNPLPGGLLDNVVVSENKADDRGGGIYATGSDFSLASIHVVGNQAGYHGGGIAVVNNSEIYIYPNFPIYALAVGPTVCDPSLLPSDVYCSVISNNQAGLAGASFGGGVYLDGASSATISSTDFSANQADIGAALYSGSGFSHFYLSNNLFHHNTGDPVIRMGDTGILSMWNNTITDNDATAVFFDSSSPPPIFNNNIIWGNTVGVFLNGVTPSGGCNDTQTSLGLPDDISEDPQFVRVPRGDYRLGWNSPVIDACSSGPLYDMDGVVRPYGADYDMGAFEFVPLKIYLPLTSRD